MIVPCIFSLPFLRPFCIIQSLMDTPEFESNRHLHSICPNVLNVEWFDVLMEFFGVENFTLRRFKMPLVTAILILFSSKLDPNSLECGENESIRRKDGMCFCGLQFFL